MSYLRVDYLINIRPLDIKPRLELIQISINTVKDMFSVLIDLATKLRHTISGTTEDLNSTYSLFARFYVASDLPCFIRNLRVTFKIYTKSYHLHMRLNALWNIEVK
jgi:hypothetical protein